MLSILHPSLIDFIPLDTPQQCYTPISFATTRKVNTSAPTTTITKATSSPFRHLPTEIITEIFSALAEEEEPIKVHSIPDIWHCAQVCGRWRSIICETMPKMWSSIELDIDATQNVDATSNILNTYLTRSSDRPLSITLKRNIRLAIAGDDDNSAAHITRYLRLLIPHSTRWEKFSCHGIFINELDLFAPIKGLLPILRQLHLYIQSDIEDDSRTAIDTFVDAPLLRSAKIVGSRLARPAVHLPWSQLTAYEACHPLHEVLHLATDLETCCISGRPDVHDPSKPSIDHDRLHTLSVHSPHTLYRLSLPSLRSLSVNVNCISQIPHITSFIRSSSSSLEHLKLTGNFQVQQCELEPLRDLFRATSSLITLDFALPCSSALDALFTVLTIPDDGSDSAVSPQLQSLAVETNIWPVVREETGLVAMIMSRYRAPTPLRDFTLRVMNPGKVLKPSIVQMEQMKQLEQEGLSLHVQ